MNIEEERKAFESQECVKELIKFTGFSIESNQYYIQKNGLSQSGIEWLNGGWQMWQAATKRAEEKLEGCVVVNSESLLFHAQSIRTFNNGDWENVCQEIEEHVCAIEKMLEAARSGNE